MNLHRPYRKPKTVPREQFIDGTLVALQKLQKRTTKYVPRGIGDLLEANVPMPLTRMKPILNGLAFDSAWQWQSEVSTELDKAGRSRFYGLQVGALACLGTHRQAARQAPHVEARLNRLLLPLPRTELLGPYDANLDEHIHRVAGNELAEVEDAMSKIFYEGELSPGATDMPEAQYCRSGAFMVNLWLDVMNGRAKISDELAQIRHADLTSADIARELL